jgi:hypothetical protein
MQKIIASLFAVFYAAVAHADPVPFSAYGTILDAQTVNESTGATVAGAALGAAAGSATYADKASSYSATSHLGAAVLGGLVGSLFDSPARAKYRTRYTLKGADGVVRYVEEISAEPFHHSPGMCVVLFPMRLAPPDFCTVGGDALPPSPIAVDDVVWVFQSPARAYETPATAAAPVRELAVGVAVKVVHIFKDRLKVRSSDGALFWVPKDSVRTALTL